MFSKLTIILFKNYLFKYKFCSSLRNWFYIKYGVRYTTHNVRNDIYAGNKISLELSSVVRTSEVVFSPRWKSSHNAMFSFKNGVKVWSRWFSLVRIYAFRKSSNEDRAKKHRNRKITTRFIFIFRAKMKGFPSWPGKVSFKSGRVILPIVACQQQ